MAQKASATNSFGVHVQSMFMNLIFSISSSVGLMNLIKAGTACLAAALVAYSQLAMPLLEKEMSNAKDVIALEVLSKQKIENIDCEQFAKSPIDQTNCRVAKTHKKELNAVSKTVNGFVSFCALLFYMFGSVAIFGYLLRLAEIPEK